ncbi:MAG: type I DNA topoisomerase [Cytophagales bacterium]|jgi:DNA topoisomerase-1|nr:type I DNA topoisomerase [Cytophagales bacterium]
MNKFLVIVESPAKAKTIKKFLSSDYNVTSSQGHIRDLPAKELAVDIENDFTPTYVVNGDKKKLVNELKVLSLNAEIVYLASDDDREGEAISWHLKEALGLTEERIKRIVFHEITSKAILNAIKNPRTINTNLVNSQQARRILDRLVGYELSPVLWKKIKSGLSAGRVQSVAVKMIVDRERTIQKFEITGSFKVNATFFTAKGEQVVAELKKNIDTYEKTKTIISDFTKAKFVVTDIEKKQATKFPHPPFTTSTLQQEACHLLGFNVSQTMLLAQHLYENGKISYMRTDSVILSEDALEQAKNVILKDYGKEYFEQRNFKTKSRNAQEAHEAIRPTNFFDVQVSEDVNEQKLYNLIRRRALASQMAEAKIDRTTITIMNDVSKTNIFVLKGSVVVFDGFLKIYKNSDDEENDEDKFIPEINANESLVLQNVLAKERFSRGPLRFNEASLVKELEEQGIGRPSTYAPIISTIQKRGYVIERSEMGKMIDCRTLKWENGELNEGIVQERSGSQKNKLFPTDIAMVVNDFLVEYFPDITHYDFTAEIENQLDLVAKGKDDWVKMIHKFHDKFAEQLVAISSKDQPKISTTKFLGNDPQTNKPIYARITQFGSVLQLGDKTESQTPKYVNLLKTQNIETITLEEALQLFAFPKNIGEYKDHEIILDIGAYGPYVKWNSINASLPAGEYDISNLPLDVAVQAIEKRIAYDEMKKAKGIAGKEKVQEKKKFKEFSKIKRGKTKKTQK